MLKRLVPALVAMLFTLPLTSAVGLAAGPTTDVFEGTATTGAGQVLPVDVNPADVSLRADGAIGLGYTYRAAGQARGKLRGRFTYEEHGYLFFTNPADPTTFAGSQFTSGVFTVAPVNGSAPVVVKDTDPTAYQHGLIALPASHAHGALAGFSRLVDRKTGALPKGGTLTFGYFTFTDPYGTFTGLATPDFRRFQITITF